MVFVRKRLPEIQYLRATMREEQRNRFYQLLENTIRQIESAQFPARSGIRFPQPPWFGDGELTLVCLTNLRTAQAA